MTPDWIETTETHKNFPNKTRGVTYTYEVQAQGPSGGWSESTKKSVRIPTGGGGGTQPPDDSGDPPDDPGTQNPGTDPEPPGPPPANTVSVGSAYPVSPYLNSRPMRSDPCYAGFGISYDVSGSATVRWSISDGTSGSQTVSGSGSFDVRSSTRYTYGTYSSVTCTASL